jgi:heat shock protein HslJ
VQTAGITFAVSAEGQSNRLVANGSAGCNTWNATVILREDQIDVMNIATTRKMCPKPRMTTEDAFIATLKSAQRWRIDDKGRLIIEGEAARLLLTGIGGDKPLAKKPAK